MELGVYFNPSFLRSNPEALTEIAPKICDLSEVHIIDDKEYVYESEGFSIPLAAFNLPSAYSDGTELGKDVIDCRSKRFSDPDKLKAHISSVMKAFYKPPKKVYYDFLFDDNRWGW